MRPGRKPRGPGFVDGLSGSAFAKKRLEQILRTLSGEATIADACAELGISRSRFYDLRTSLLEEMVERLEPRPRGRLSEKAEDNDEARRLEQRIAELEVELEATQIREQMNTLMPVYRTKKNEK